jgi:ribosomal protein L24
VSGERLGAVVVCVGANDAGIRVGIDVNGERVVDKVWTEGAIDMGLFVDGTLKIDGAAETGLFVVDIVGLSVAGDNVGAMRGAVSNAKGTGIVSDDGGVIIRGGLLGAVVRTDKDTVVVGVTVVRKNSWLGAIELKAAPVGTSDGAPTTRARAKASNVNLISTAAHTKSQSRSKGSWCQWDPVLTVVNGDLTLCPPFFSISQSTLSCREVSAEVRDVSCNA